MHWNRRPHRVILSTMRGGWVYIMTNKPGGVLYIGVTADLAARVAQHREGSGSAFCRRYNLTRLVLAEEYPSIDEATAREKAMKEWNRDWKIRLIEQSNPRWEDLWSFING
ncbi:MAG TPA: GIY-YIG nuclease family protein [Allosphingosinicella sp.]|nr:GIY-YIG nuclease family protein [Allosphingosinicella sp.]